MRIRALSHRTAHGILAMCALLCASCSAKAPTDVHAALLAGSEDCLHYGFDAAADEFSAARAASPADTPEHLQATLGLAVALDHQTPISLARVNQAAALFEEVATSGGTSPLAAQACLDRGRIAEERDTGDDTVDLPTARTWYQRVITGWPDDPIAGEATLRLAVTWIQTLDPDQVKTGIALCEARAARPQEPWAGALWKQAGESWWICLRDGPDSMRCLIHAEEAGLPDQSRAWQTAWRIAQLAETSGQTPIAIDHYRRIITRYPTSGKAWEAQQRMRALGAEAPPITLMILPESSATAASATAPAVTP